MLALRVGTTDFHFMLRMSNGSWTHKPGSTCILKGNGNPWNYDKWVCEDTSNGRQWYSDNHTFYDREIKYIVFWKEGVGCYYAQKKNIVLIILSCILILLVSIAIYISFSINNLSQTMKLQRKKEESRNVYSAESLADIYWQPKNKIAVSASYTIDDIEQYVKVEFLRKTKIFDSSLMSFLYYTDYQLDGGEMLIVFDKTGRELYTMIVSESLPAYSDFESLTIEEATFENVKTIDPSAILITKIPKIINQASPDCEPYSVHILSDYSVLYITYDKKNDEYKIKDMICEKKEDLEIDIERLLKYIR